jgi:hypothetical protein
MGLKFQKKSTNYCKLIFIYFFFFTISSLLFIAQFWIKILDSLDILLFKSFISIFISICITLLLFFFLKKKKILKIISIKDIIIICLLSFTLNNLIYTLIPFNTSRSVSVMLVGYLYNNENKNISKTELEDHIYKLYFIKEDAINKRLEEQIKFGNIEIIENQYKLTNKGLIIVKFMNMTTEIFNTKKNYIKYIGK